MATATYTPTQAQAAYEATQEFQAYMKTREAWTDAHTVYVAYPCDRNRRNLLLYREAMDAALTQARRTPEHFAAFCW
jgi:hypothetical protein